jgi:uncharacterized protein with HEPN domain
MAKDDLVYVEHMLDLARQIKTKVNGLDRSSFDADENLRLAITHLIQTIGEAARLVSDDFKAAHASVPWRQITGMRHRIVHDYLNVDFDVVWEVTQRDIRTLIQQLDLLVAGGRGGTP